MSQFRRRDHGIGILLFASLFIVSAVAEGMQSQWRAAVTAGLAVAASIWLYRNRPGVVLRSDRVVVFSDWYRRRSYELDTVDRLEVNEGSWTKPVQLVLNDGARRTMPMLGFGKRPNRYERRMIDALSDSITVEWVQEPT